MASRTRHLVAVLAMAFGLIGVPVAHAEPGTAPVHVVQAGDTLWQIAQDAGTDVPTLQRLNGLSDDDVLSVGQTLKLTAATAPAPALAKSNTYTVADGDTLSGIAQQLGTTTAALVDANHLDDPDQVKVGAELVVPAAAATAASRTVPPPTAVATAARAVSGRRIVVTYTVQPGETLSQIARQFDVRLDTIAQSTGLDDPNRIVVGSVLKVPLPGYEHVVTAGETLRDIAAQEKVDLGSLIDFNEIDDPELIRVGQVVLVPAAAPGLQVAAAGTAKPAQAAAPASAPASAPAPASAAAPSPTPTAKPAAAATPAPAPAPKPSQPAAAPPPSQPAAAPPPGAPSQGVTSAAMKLLGAPYVWGGSSPSGFDCSGYVWYAVRQAGKSISRGLLGQYNSGAHPGRDELAPGDLVFFQNTYTPGLSHNGIYLGNGQFVHAADEASGVTVSSLSTAYWSSHWFGATRLP